jgi:hypothetical protein
VIKLLATVPAGGTCVNSAAGVSTANLSAGLAAWGTTLHASALTETPFIASTLGASELSRLSSTCSAISARGSGFGICDACRVGGLGEAAQQVSAIAEMLPCLEPVRPGCIN